MPEYNAVVVVPPAKHVWRYMCCVTGGRLWKPTNADILRICDATGGTVDE